MRHIGGRILIVSIIVFVSTRLQAQLIPNDPAFPAQWSLHNTGQPVGGSAGLIGADIDAPSAWAAHLGTRSTIVAVVGSGVSDSLDLQGRLLEGGATTGDLFDSRDGCGSGTLAASVVGAGVNDAVGIAGICGRCSILPIRIAQGCSATTASAALGIRQAVDQGASVILAAMQFPQGSQALADAVTYALSNDVLVVAPVGDDAANQVYFPAAYAEVIAVSASNNMDQPSGFSNVGPEVELSAPGEDIVAVNLTGATVVVERAEMLAAAHVAGAAALVRSFAPAMTSAQVRQILIDSADDLGAAGWDEQFGFGRLNVGAAMMKTPAPPFRFELVGGLPNIIEPGSDSRFVVSIVDGPAMADPAAVTLFYRDSPGPFLAHSAVSLGSTVYQIAFPSLACGLHIDYFLSAASAEGISVSEPLAAPMELHHAIVSKRELVFTDDFEVSRGWTTTTSGGAATTGAWVRVTPVGTSAQPGFDASADDKTMCYVTGQHFGGSAGTNDVDGGPVQLLSPVVPMSAPDALISYWVWFHSSGEGQADTLLVELSRDGGQLWTLVEQIGGTSGWEPRQFRVSDFSQRASGDLQLRFTTADLTNDSLTEAAIDEFKVEAILCVPPSADFDGSGIVDVVDGSALAGCLGGPERVTSDNTCLTLDFDADLDLDLHDWHAWVDQFGELTR